MFDSFFRKLLSPGSQSNRVKKAKELSKSLLKSSWFKNEIRRKVLRYDKKFNREVMKIFNDYFKKRKIKPKEEGIDEDVIHLALIYFAEKFKDNGGKHIYIK